MKGPHVRELHAWLAELAKRGRDASATTASPPARHAEGQSFGAPLDLSLAPHTSLEPHEQSDRFSR
jgi:hypothetical protein